MTVAGEPAVVPFFEKEVEDHPVAASCADIRRNRRHVGAAARQRGRSHQGWFGNVHVGHISASEESSDASPSLLLFRDRAGRFKDRANLTLTRDNRALAPFAIRFAGLCGYLCRCQRRNPIVTTKSNCLNVSLILMAANGPVLAC